MNFSNAANATTTAKIPSTPEEQGQLIAVHSTFHIAFLFVTIFAALVGNLLVLTATYLDKRLHKPNKYFVASLAVSDLLVVMFSVTMRLHIYLNQGNALTLAFCRFHIWVDIFTEAASITTLTVICVDRYYKVSRPFRYKANMTTRRACRIIGIIWMYSALLAVLGLIPYSGKGVHVKRTTTCVNDSKTFYTLAALLGFFIPVAILITLCTLIFRIVQQHSRRRLPSKVSDTTRIHHRRQAHSNRRSFLTLALIVLTFIVCWGPFFVLFVTFQYNPAPFEKMGKYGFMILQTICFGILPYCNSFLNPVIYAFFDKTFNVAIKDMLLKFSRGSKRYSMARKSIVTMSRETPV